MDVVTDAEVMGMFQLGGELDRMDKDDPRREQLEETYRRMKDTFVSEKIPAAKPAEPPDPEWMAALQYVAGMFAQMDAIDPAGSKKRKSYWNEIYTGVTEWNKPRAEAKNPNEDGIIEP